MVEEALTEPDTSILLLSYTNRAVDEICHMLVSSGIAARTPFIRIGNELSCDTRYVPYLLKHSLDDCPKLKDIRQRILETRIFVGTTTAINNRLNLFSLKSFSLAIIDEASQILEPDLIGILSARYQTQNAIGKFILIGDYKQLPAIAQQSPEEAAIHHPLLQAIGLTDCRNSLFERLYKQCDASVRSILTSKGECIRLSPNFRIMPSIIGSNWNPYHFPIRKNPAPTRMPPLRQIPSTVSCWNGAWSSSPPTNHFLPVSPTRPT